MSLVPKPQDPKDWRRMKTRMNSDLQNTQTKESSGEKSDVMISWKKPSFLSHGEPHCKSESNTRTGIDEGKSTVKHREVRKTKEGKTLWWRWKKNGTSRSTVLKHEAKQNPAHCVPFFFFVTIYRKPASNPVCCYSAVPRYAYPCEDWVVVCGTHIQLFHDWWL